MENDDRPIGRVLSRREALALLGTAGAAILAACVGLAETGEGTGEATQSSAGVSTQAPAAGTTESLPACVVRPELTEGPYYVDADLDRSDIRSDPSTGEVKEGALLALTFKVSQIASGGCTPLEGAKVEIWHCDAAGVYSGVSDPGFDTTGQKFLRGYRVTDANGGATFITIYPGWYSGRAVHIHFKIHHDATDQSREFTSQLFFDDSLSDRVFAQEPYAGKGQQDTLNSNDNIYDDQLLLTVSQTDEGYAATFDIGMEMA
jgi:protocatechuate 3,4-dioxygenase beta subunit